MLEVFTRVTGDGDWRVTGGPALTQRLCNLTEFQLVAREQIGGQTAFVYSCRPSRDQVWQACLVACRVFIGVAGFPTFRFGWPHVM